MGRFLKRLFWLIVGIVLLLAALGFAGLWVANNYAPTIVDKIVASKTGFSVQIDDSAVNLGQGNLDFKGLTVDNPKGYPKQDFIVANELAANWDLRKLINFATSDAPLVINKMLVDIKSFTGVRNSKGNINIQDFIKGLNSKAKKDRLGRQGPSEGIQEPFKFNIKELTLKLGTVRWVDYSSKVPIEKDFDLNYEQSFQNVTSGAAIARSIRQHLMQIGANALVQNLVGSLFNFSSYQQGLESLGNKLLQDSSDVIDQTSDAINNAAEKAGSSIKKIFDGS